MELFFDGASREGACVWWDERKELIVDGLFNWILWIQINELLVIGFQFHQPLIPFSLIKHSSINKEKKTDGWLSSLGQN